MDRGFVFAADSFVACFAMLACIFLVFASVSFLHYSLDGGHERDSELLFASSLSETLVKNRDPDFPERGCAFFDSAKRRIVSNLLDPVLLAQAKPVHFGKYFFAAMYERDFSGKNYYFNSAFGACVSSERLVRVNGIVPRKTVLGVVVCE